jgi:hypothetical protein
MKWLLLILLLVPGLLLADDQPGGTADQPKETSSEEENSKKEDCQEEDSKKKEKDKDKEKEKGEEEEAPWFIGTLLAFFGENIEKGRLLVQPFLFVMRRYGFYDAHSSLVRDRNNHLYMGEVILEGGLTEKIDFTLDLLATDIYTGGHNAFSLGDTFFALGFQMLKDKKGTSIPDLRVVVGENFPTGKYDHLNPVFKADDATGTGAYATWLLFIGQKIFYTWPKHPYKWNVNLGMIHFSDVHVKGFNFYGGDETTKGLVKPGERFYLNVAWEYKFDENWGCGIDLHYEYQNSSSFHNQGGDTLFQGGPSTETFSLAPEIEYNFNANFAISAGLWGSVLGRNSPAFFGGVFTVSYIF